MTSRRPCPPAPGPLEDYAQRFDALFSSLAQRRGFRDYLQGLLLPRDRNKTLTGLAGAEPITGAQHREVQRLQWFLSESAWDHQQVNDRRVQLSCEDPATAPHDAGALVVDDTGDRKDGTANSHVARQYLGSVGKIDNGIVAVTSLWADARCYWPVHAVPYTPASRLVGGPYRDQATVGEDPPRVGHPRRPERPTGGCSCRSEDRVADGCPVGSPPPVEQGAGADDRHGERGDELGAAIDLRCTLRRLQPVLVVDDQDAAAYGLLWSQLGPGGQVPLEVCDQGLGGRAAGGLNLDQAALLPEGRQQVG
jgi:hypothetical protein